MSRKLYELLKQLSSRYKPTLKVHLAYSVQLFALVIIICTQIRPQVACGCYALGGKTMLVVCTLYEHQLKITTFYFILYRSQGCFVQQTHKTNTYRVIDNEFNKIRHIIYRPIEEFNLDRNKNYQKIKKKTTIRPCYMYLLLDNIVNFMVACVFCIKLCKLSI